MLLYYFKLYNKGAKIDLAGQPSTPLQIPINGSCIANELYQKKPILSISINLSDRQYQGG